MDLTDILGGLLGQKTSSPQSGGGGAGDILRDILGGGRPREAAPAPQRGGASSVSEGDLAAQARELEDLLNVAKGRQAKPGATNPPRSQAPPAAAPSPAPRPAPFPSGAPRTTQPPASRQDELSLLLIRAMLNAAKCDGQITADEQQAIFEQLGNPTPEVVQFLRDECAQPLDVREFAWSVPLGTEAQVYGMSLLAIRGQSDRETAYLDELAHGLRIPPQVREQLHARYSR